jgi:hypothetical protein
MPSSDLNLPVSLFLRGDICIPSGLFGQSPQQYQMNSPDNYEAFHYVIYCIPLFVTFWTSVVISELHGELPAYGGINIF